MKAHASPLSMICIINGMCTIISAYCERWVSKLPTEKRFRHLFNAYLHWMSEASIRCGSPATDLSPLPPFVWRRKSLQLISHRQFKDTTVKVKYCHHCIICQLSFNSVLVISHSCGCVRERERDR